MMEWKNWPMQRLQFSALAVSDLLSVKDLPEAEWATLFWWTDINPDANVETYKEFYMDDCELDIITKDLSYAVDCVDTIMAKIAIICACDEIGVPVMSSMGTGNKLDPTMFEVADIYETSVCPLARIMKKDMRKRNIEKLKVVYSKEHAINTNDCPINHDRKFKVKGSVSFVPSVAGLMIAGEVIKDIAGV